MKGVRRLHGPDNGNSKSRIRNSFFPTPSISEVFLHAERERRVSLRVKRRLESLETVWNLPVSGKFGSNKATTFPEQHCQMQKTELIGEDFPGKPLSQELLELKKRISLSWEALSREFHRVMGEEGPSNTTLFRYATGRVKRKNPMVERYVRDAIHKITIELVQKELAESETRRKRVEKNLVQTEVRFRKMVEHAKDIIFRYRLLPTPGFEYLSPSVFDIAGYTPQEYYADPDLAVQIVHPDDRPIIEAHLSDDMGFDETLTIRWIHKDGTTVWVEESKVPIYDAEGMLVAVEGIIRDITERKKAEKDTLYLAAIVESSDDAIVGATTDAMVASWNTAAEKLLGYKAEEIIGQHISLIHPPEEPGLSQRIHERLLRGEMVKFPDVVRVTKEGQRINVSLTSSAIKDQHGHIIGFSGILRDISERKQKDETLAKSEAKYRRLVEGIQDEYFLYSHDTDGYFTYVSPSITKVLGYSQEEFLTHYVEYLTDTDMAAVVRHNQQAIRGHQQNPYQYQIFHKDGSVRTLKVVETPVTGADGKVIAVEGIAHDITGIAGMQG